MDRNREPTAGEAQVDVHPEGISAKGQIDDAVTIEIYRHARAGNIVPSRGQRVARAPREQGRPSRLVENRVAALGTIGRILRTPPVGLASDRTSGARSGVTSCVKSGVLSCIRSGVAACVQLSGARVAASIRSA
jgi:hypothetical protein